MISTSGILSTGQKKCRPMKSAGPVDAVASSVIGSVEVLEHSSASALTYGCDLGEDLVLERGVLEDGLDHQVAAREVGRVGGRGDPVEERSAFFFAVDLAALRRPWSSSFSL